MVRLYGWGVDCTSASFVLYSTPTTDGLSLIIVLAPLVFYGSAYVAVCHLPSHGCLQNEEYGERKRNEEAAKKARERNAGKGGDGLSAGSSKQADDGVDSDGVEIITPKLGVLRRKAKTLRARDSALEEKVC